MRAILLSCMFLSSLSLHAAEVTLTTHPEIAPWEYYNKPLPKPSWNNDGSLSVWAIGHNTGSASILESEPRVVLSEQMLSLCYSRRPIEYVPNKPIPAVLLPVVLEFRVRGLAAGEYVVHEVSVCE
jgi:hypothetical protein